MPSPLIVLRDEARPYAVCPECHARLELPALAGERWTVRSPSDIAARLQFEMASLEQEELRAVILNTKNYVIQVVTVVRGSINSAQVRIAECFREAIRLNAAGIILVHNHPSGDPTPSPDDLHLTAETLAAGRLLDVDLLDHIVIARDAYISLRDRGVSFDRAAPPINHQ